MKQFKIAIDGPSGAGKSTMVKRLAHELGIVYVDTGALYRAVGLYIARQGLGPHDAPAIIRRLPFIKIDLRYEKGEQRVFLGGEDVTGLIRTETASRYASGVSAIAEVRTFLLDLQRDIARRNSVVMDGRDIGTVVLPDADVKIFLSATSEERARRRFEEQLANHQDVTYEQVFEALVNRDRDDSARTVAPLVAAEDAVVLDTTGFTVEQSYALIRRIIEERLPNA